MQNHCDMIAAHLLDLQHGEEDAAPAAAAAAAAERRKLTLCVEGNISAGKSSFLKMLSAEVSLHEYVEVRRRLTVACIDVGGEH